MTQRFFCQINLTTNILTQKTVTNKKKLSFFKVLSLNSLKENVNELSRSTQFSPVHLA